MLGNYVKTTFNNGALPAINSDYLNNLEDKVEELDNGTEEVTETTDFTLGLEHVGKLVRCESSSSDITVTVNEGGFPLNAEVYFLNDCVGHKVFVAIGVDEDVIFNGTHTTTPAEISEYYYIGGMKRTTPLSTETGNEKWVLFGNFA